MQKIIGKYFSEQKNIAQNKLFSREGVGFDAGCAWYFAEINGECNAQKKELLQNIFEVLQQHIRENGLRYF